MGRRYTLDLLYKRISFALLFHLTYYFVYRFLLIFGSPSLILNARFVTTLRLPMQQGA